tara:strand:+ start:2413 stop:2571 length:159 start_codon:yes stop_codon:yes gene_type:complete
MSKYFNTTEHKLKEQRKDRLMTALVYLTLAFATIGVMFTFSFTITKVMGWVL